MSRIQPDQQVAVINDAASPTGYSVAAVGEPGESWAVVWSRVPDSDAMHGVFSVKEARKQFAAELEHFTNRN